MKTMPPEIRARLAEAALRVLEAAARGYPGLINHDDTVDGADLTESLTADIAADAHLRAHLNITYMRAVREEIEQEVARV